MIIRTGSRPNDTRTARLRIREIDGELSYGRGLLDGKAWLGGNLFYRREPGHIAYSPDDVGAAIRFNLDF